MLSMLFVRKHVLGIIYVKLLASLANTFTVICFHSLSNLSLTSKISNMSVATSILNLMFLVGSTLFMQSKTISSS